MDDDPPATRKRWQLSTIAVAAPRGERSKHAPFDATPSRRFEEGEELGRGGMGRVYEAYDVTLDRAVAIKQSLQDDPNVLERFEREVMITAKLQHPGIVPILDAGRDEDGRPYFVMRKIEGRLLAERVEEATTVRAKLALVPSLLGAVDAVAYAHAQGVVHRDLKPWNILLGPFGEVLVIDWGLACVLGEPDLERAGSAYGTPGFMAPEQARGEPSDRRSDVYALGATLTYVLTGAWPFQGSTPTEMIEASARGDLPAIAVPGEVPVELAAIATKAMAPAPADRYADAGELSADLRRFLEGQLVAAHAYTPRQLLARWIRRHRVAIGVGAIALVALAALGGFSLRRAIVARDLARVASERERLRADDALVERARSVAPNDPDRALAILAQLSDGSPAWRRARDVAESARAAGPSWGFDARIENPIASVLVASPSGARFAVSRDRELLVGEPSLRVPPRVVATLDVAPDQLIWVGETAVIARCERRVIRIELATGIQHGLREADVLVAAADGHPFVLTAGQLLEVGGQPVGAATAARRMPGAIVYSSGNQIFYRADGAAPVVVATGFDRFDVATTRIVVRNATEVRELEWHPAGFTQRGVWQLDDAVHPFYVGGRLVARIADRVAWLDPGKPPAWAALPDKTERGPDTFDAGVPGSVLVVGDTHILYSHAGHAAIPLATFPAPMATVVRAGRWLVGVSVRGELRAWAVDQIMPRMFALPPETSLIAIFERHLWITGNEIDGLAHVARIDLASGVGDTGAISPASTFACETRGRVVFALDREIHVAKTEPFPLLVADLPSFAQPHKLSPPTRLVACVPDAGLLVEADGTEVVIRRAEALDTIATRYAFSNPIVQVVGTAHWIAVIDSAHVVTRIFLATGHRDTLVTTGPTGLTLADAGQLAIVHADGVELWSVDGSRHALDHLRLIRLEPNPLGFVGQTATKQLVVISPAGDLVTRINIGVDVLPCIAHDAPTVYFSENDKLATIDLRDGSIVRFPWPVDSLACSTDASVAVARGRLSSDAVVVNRVLPVEPSVLRGWIAATTNAVLEPGATEISWR